MDREDVKNILMKSIGESSDNIVGELDCRGDLETMNAKIEIQGRLITQLFKIFIQARAISIKHAVSIVMDSKTLL